MKSNDEKCEKISNDMREEILKSALKELDGAKIRCNIPSFHSSSNAKNYCPFYTEILLNHSEKVSHNHNNHLINKKLL